MLKMYFVASCFLILLALAGCVKAPTVIEPTEPEWVRLGSGAYHTNRGQAFYGVAVASGVNSQLLLRATADNLARQELFKVLETYAGMLSGRSAAAGVDQAAADGMQPLIQNSLNSAAIEEHWFDDQNGRLYSLCRSDLNTFKEALARYNYFEMSQRNAMLNRADRIHAQMAAQKQP